MKEFKESLENYGMDKKLSQPETLKQMPFLKGFIKPLVTSSEPLILKIWRKKIPGTGLYPQWHFP